MASLSAIIVNFRSAGETAACIESMLSCDSPPEEIIVVNNSPEYDNLKTIQNRDPVVTVVQSPRNLGMSGGVNLGCEHASSALLLVANPDVEFDKGSIAVLRRSMAEDPAIGVIGPKVLDPAGTRQLSARRFPRWSTFFFHRTSILTKLFPANRFSRGYLDQAGGAETPVDVDWVSGCCMMIRREAFEQAGMFDDGYFLFMEDVDFCWHIWKTNRYRVVYDPLAVVTHHVGISNAKAEPWLIRDRHASIRRFIDKYFSASPAIIRSVAKGIITLRQNILLLTRRVRRSRRETKDSADNQ